MTMAFYKTPNHSPILAAYCEPIYLLLQALHRQPLLFSPALLLLQLALQLHQLLRNSLPSLQEHIPAATITAAAAVRVRSHILISASADTVVHANKLYCIQCPALIEEDCR